MKNKIIKYSICISALILIIFLYFGKLPVIKLNGNDFINIEVNNKYKDLGYNVYKNNKVLNIPVSIKNNINTNKLGIYSVIYELKYKGIKIKKVRRVKVVDTHCPNIKLNGTNEKNIFLNEKYVEDGYIAIDNYDGNITDKVSISSNLKNEVGKYEIVYTVKDSSNNSCSVKRKVNVIENNNGVVYLTFDDGPSNITNGILDILKKNNVKATFFLVGFNDNMNDIVKRIYDEGHTIGLHSNTHIYNEIYSSAEAYYSDLYTLSSKIKKLINIDTKIIRFPGGSSNTISSFNKGIMSYLSKDVLKNGFHYFDWNVSAEDAYLRSEKEVYNNVIYGLSKNRSNVVLLHDFYNNYKTLNALDKIIKDAKLKGYVFSNITYNTPMVHHTINN